MSMSKQYVHLNMTERDQITIMLCEGKNISEIAKALGRSKGTISRELQRNSSTEYKKYLSHRHRSGPLIGEPVQAHAHGLKTT